MKYRIGLDIGIASVGWAVLQTDKDDEACRIVNRGVRVFDPAEAPKNGDSLKALRRELRGVRRVIRRKKSRIKLAKRIIEEDLNIELDKILSDDSIKLMKNIYSVRYLAIEEKLQKEEFARLLYHLIHRRGYQSNSKKKNSAEEGKVKKAINKNNEILLEKGYRTPGEFFYKECGDKFTKSDGTIIVTYNTRNTSGDYQYCFDRKTIENEIKLIFEVQRGLGNDFASKQLEDSYLYVFSKQISYGVGPGGNSPYRAKSGSLILDMYGKCTFETDEIRASKLTPTFEKFMLWSKLNNLVINKSGTKRFLTMEEKEAIALDSYKREKTKYTDVRKALNKIGINVSTFNGLPYSRKIKVKKTEAEIKEDPKYKYKFEYVSAEEVEDKNIFVSLKANKLFEKAFGKDCNIDDEVKDKIATAISLFHDEEVLKNKLAGKGANEDKYKIPDEYIEDALKLERIDAKPSNLSIKAIRKILPFIKEGDIYSVACQKAGYNHSEFNSHNKTKVLNFNEIITDIKNPVVIRSISQTFKVINAIVRKYKSQPEQIYIETARELAKTFKERKDIEARNKENNENNRLIEEEIRAVYKFNPKPFDIVKYKLFKEQKGECAYSNKVFKADRLFESNYTQVDHIIPYSISFDDSYANKVLVLSEENQNKGNRLPLQFFAGNDEKIQRFKNWVNNSNLSRTKKANLLMEDYESEDFKDRNINDTRYATKFVMNYIKNNFEFANSKHTNKVLAIKGGMTSYFRKSFKLNKSRDDDNHHAVDAIIVGMFSEALIQKISNFNKTDSGYFYDKKSKEYIDKETGEVSKDLKVEKSSLIQKQLPYEHFLEELEMWMSENPNSENFIERRKDWLYYSDDEIIKPLFVSRMPKRKISGEAHLQTVKKLIEINGQKYFIERVALEKLTLEKGEIKDYYDKESDLLLYNALKKRMLEFRDSAGKVDTKRAFAEPFRKPLSNGDYETGPIVKKVKTIKKCTLYVDLPDRGDNAAASNGNMSRIDIFSKTEKGKEKYYLIPIYVSDFYKKELPNKLCTKYWKDVDDKYVFKFSLFPNDLIFIETKEGDDIDAVSKEYEIETRNEDGTFQLEKKKDKKSFNKLLAYYNNTDIDGARIIARIHNREFSFKKAIQNLKCLKKMQVSILGDVSECGYVPRNTKTKKK